MAAAGTQWQPNEAGDAEEAAEQQQQRPPQRQGHLPNGHGPSRLSGARKDDWPAGDGGAGFRATHAAAAMQPANRRNPVSALEQLAQVRALALWFLFWFMLWSCHYMRWHEPGSTSWQSVKEKYKQGPYWPSPMW